MQSDLHFVFVGKVMNKGAREKAGGERFLGDVVMNGWEKGGVGEYKCLFGTKCRGFWVFSRKMGFRIAGVGLQD